MSKAEYKNHKGWTEYEVKEEIQTIFSKETLGNSTFKVKLPMQVEFAFNEAFHKLPFMPRCKGQLIRSILIDWLVGKELRK